MRAARDTKRTATSAGRVAAALIGVLALLVTGAVAVYAGTKSPDYTLSGSPSSVNVTAGQDAVYSITVTRTDGFTGTVALTVGGLPQKATATFNPASVTGSASTLTVKTNQGGTTPDGTYSLTVTGTSGKLVKTTALTLVVGPVPGFSLSASPSARTIVTGDSDTFAITVARTGGFSGAVSLSAAGMHNQTTATFAPQVVPAASGSGSSTLTLDVANSPDGSYKVTVSGTGTVGTQTVTRTVDVTLTVVKSQSFVIGGNAYGTLYPGVTVPVNVVLTNPNPSAIKVTQLTVSIEERTSKAGCSGSANFVSIPAPSSLYPVIVPGNTSVSLQGLGVPQANWPKVEMTNAAASQDVCKGAQITLQYSGAASK